MTTASMTAGAHVAGGTPSLVDSLRAAFAAWRAAHEEKAKARHLREQFAGMDDRLLLDIGLSEVDIAALRAGESLDLTARRA